MSALESLLSNALLAGRKAYGATTQNEVNARNPDYVRVQGTAQAERVCPTMTGTSTHLRRCTDPLSLRHVGKSKTAASGFQILAKVQSDLNSLFGRVGDEGSALAGRIKTFFQTLNQPAQVAGTQAYFTQLVKEAGDVASEFNRLSSEIQSQRTDADQEIGRACSRLNTLLEEFHQCNRMIDSSESAHGDAFTARDKRDALFLQISTYLPVTSSMERNLSGSDTGVEYLYGPDGAALLTKAGANQIIFEESGALTPKTLYKDENQDGGLSGVSVQFDQLTKDLTPSLKSGLLGGRLMLRDQVLPDMQAALDEAASVFQDMINTLHNQGTAFSAPTHMENSISMDPTMDLSGRSGFLRIAQINKLTGAVVDFKDIDLSGIRTLADLQATTVWPSAPVDPHQTGIAYVGISEDAQKLLVDLHMNDLFVSETLDIQGRASRISLNPRIQENPEQIAHGMLSKDPDLKPGDTAIQSGDLSTLSKLGGLDRKVFLFNAGGTIGTKEMKIFDYGRLLMSTFASQAAAAKGKAEIADRTLNTWEERLNESQGVDPHENQIQQMEWRNYMQTMMQMYVQTLSLNQMLLSMIQGI